MKKALFLSIFLFLSSPLFSQSTENKFANLDYALRFGYIQPLNFLIGANAVYDYLVSASIGINYRVAAFYEIGVNLGSAICSDVSLSSYNFNCPVELVNTAVIREFRPSVALGSDSISSIDGRSLNFVNLYLRYCLEYVYVSEQGRSILFGFSLKQALAPLAMESGDLPGMYNYLAKISIMLSIGYAWH
jgi:hypothetical protein